MALIKHIAGIPEATQQRCVRCCEVIALLSVTAYCAFPGAIVVSEGGRTWPLPNKGRLEDCEAAE